MNKRLGIVLFSLVIAVIAASVFYKTTNSEKATQSMSIDQEQWSEMQEPPDSDLTVDAPEVVQENQTDTKLELSRINFEDLVHRCFQGESCVLSEDPWVLYLYLKESRKEKAIDLLISYLRSQLKYPEFASRYKGPLKKMIDEFYPREELQFQQAAYYNYLGDLKKSLELYLDLQKKAATDPSLRNAPNLNIANTYYDLGQFKQALPYYELARNEYISREQEVIIPSQNEMILFIEERIREIKTKLGIN